MIFRTTTAVHDRTLICLLGLAALILFCVDLNGVPLRDWDEGTVAQVAKEISQGSGWNAWLHPQLWGQPYFNKPPLLHSLIALVYRIGGVHTWTARLPGAVLTAMSVPFLFLLGREIFPTRVMALIGASVYLTLLPMLRHGRLAMLDGAITCFFIATVWMLLRSRHNPRWSYGVGMGLALMCLTKGILGVLLLAIALLFLAWDLPKHLLSPHLWRGLLLGVLPIAAWYGLQWQYYGQQFLEVGLLNQGLDRIGNTVEAHYGPPWYYLLELLKYCWPWLMFWPVGIWLTWRSRQRSWAKLILVWTIGYLLPVSIMQTKLPWYVFPVYPAIALTCGVALTAAWDACRNWSDRALLLKRLPKGWGFFLILISVISLAGIGYASPFGAEPSWALALTFLCVAISTGASGLFILQQQPRFIPILFIGLYSALFCLMVSDHWLWELGESFPVLPVANLVRQQVPANQPIYLQYGYRRPSLDFYSDRPIPVQSFEGLQPQWQQTKPIYVLTEDITPYQSVSGSLVDLGTAAGWHLISNQP